jgi:hypothetical protein
VSLATAPPIRLDLSLRTDDDGLVPLLWVAVDGVTPVAVASATMTMLFDTPAPTEEVPEPTARRVTIASTTPGSPTGWIDASQFANGRVLVRIPTTFWTAIPERFGIFDVIAVSVVGTTTRCLARGEFLVESGA